MRDTLEVVARRELRAFDDFLDRGDRGDQKSALDRELSNSALVWLRVKFPDDFLDALEFRKRLGAAEQLLAVCDPILVARGFVAKSLLAEVVHQLGGEDAERRSEQKRHRDVAVAGRPYQRNIDRPQLHAARHPPRFHRAERRRKDVRLRRHRNRLLRRNVDVLPECPSARAHDEPRAPPLRRRRMRAGKLAECKAARAGDPRRRRGSADRSRP